MFPDQQKMKYVSANNQMKIRKTLYKVITITIHKVQIDQPEIYLLVLTIKKLFRQFKCQILAQKFKNQDVKVQKT